MNFLLFFHINLCCLFVLANVCQLIFVAFCNESCWSVAQESLSMYIVLSCKEICILYGWGGVLFSVLWTYLYLRTYLCTYFWRDFWGCCNLKLSVFFSTLCLFWCRVIIWGTYISSMVCLYCSLHWCRIFLFCFCLFLSCLFSAQEK